MGQSQKKTHELTSNALACSCDLRFYVKKHEWRRARFFRLADLAPSCSVIFNAGFNVISLIGRVSGANS